MSKKNYGVSALLVGLAALAFLLYRIHDRIVMVSGYVFIPLIFLVTAWTICSGVLKISLITPDGINKGGSATTLILGILVAILYFGLGPIPIFQPSETTTEIAIFAIWLGYWMLIDFLMMAGLMGERIEP